MKIRPSGAARPFTGSISAFFAFGGTALALHDYSWGLWVAMIGGAGVILTMFLWWRDVVREAEFQGHHTKVVQLGLRYGVLTEYTSTPISLS